MAEGQILSNVDLWEYSLQHPEKILDYSYFVDLDRLVIPSQNELHGGGHSKQKKNDLTTLEQEIIRVISEISELKDAQEMGNDSRSELIQKLKALMEKPSANLTTFRSFWPVLDMSHSVYSSLSDVEKREFLEVAVKEFISKRHSVYKNYGYSLSVLQVLADANAHKSQGATAAHKLSDIFESYSLKKAKSSNEFLSTNMSYALMEEGIRISDLKPMCKKLNIKFEWHEENQKKKPDFFLHLKNSVIYFGEAKHKKEGGGGQNDQIKEIIKFIGFSENREDFGYISFLDGIYFNTLIPNVQLTGKTKLNKGHRQSKEIRDSLTKNSSNYFVNTEGMKKFLKQKLK